MSKVAQLSHNQAAPPKPLGKLDTSQPCFFSSQALNQTGIVKTAKTAHCGEVSFQCVLSQQLLAVSTPIAPAPTSGIIEATARTAEFVAWTAAQPRPAAT